MTSEKSSHHTIEDTNSLIKHATVEQDTLFVKRYPPKPLNAKMVKYTLLRLVGYDIPVEYRPASQRREFEKSCLSIWHAKGFHVPHVLPLPRNVSDNPPGLAMEMIHGDRIDRYLANDTLSNEEKLSTLSEVYAEMRNRHCFAIFEENHRLIHYDANLRNLIIRFGQPYHLDFEMGHLKEDIEHSAAREVKKFSLQVLNVLGRDWLDQIIELLITRYNIRLIVYKLIDEELKRPLMKLHVRRDQKRKQRNTGLITKIDLAMGLQSFIGAQSQRKSSEANNIELRQAMETSWDGRFYQSLDDSDFRGRDMNHRYAVMGFPDRFQNQSLLDIGCNIGRICVDAKKRGASRAVGFDNRNDVIDAMNRYFSKTGTDITLYTFNINDGVEALKSLIGPEMFDYVCALSIWSHVQQQRLWEIINTYCAKVCFFEDNYPSRVKSLDHLQNLLRENLNFSSIEFLGFTTDRGVRSVFRLTK